MHAYSVNINSLWGLTEKQGLHTDLTNYFGFLWEDLKSGVYNRKTVCGVPLWKSQVLLRMSEVPFCLWWKQAEKGHGTEHGVCSGFVWWMNEARMPVICPESKGTGTEPWSMPCPPLCALCFSCVYKLLICERDSVFITQINQHLFISL